MTTTYPQTFAGITLLHNHGSCALKDARIEDGYMIGTCVGGGEVARLFGATSYTAYPTGVERREYIGRTQPSKRCGDWVIDATFC